MESSLGQGAGAWLILLGLPFCNRLVTAYHPCDNSMTSVVVDLGDGSGGDSIYGGKFNDDKAALKLKHESAGLLSMANSGRNSNTSQFFMTLAPAPKCDGKHVIFGEVIEGLSILHKIGKSLPDLLSLLAPVRHPGMCWASVLLAAARYSACQNFQASCHEHCCWHR